MKQNILHFVNASLLSDLVILLLFYLGFFGSIPTLLKWYQDYRLSAVLADVLSVTLGAIVTTKVYNLIFVGDSFLKFTTLFVLLQVMHDFLFYGLISAIPKGFKIFDLFKAYTAEQGISAIKGDSIMILLASIFLYFSNTGTVTFLSLMYLTPYILYLK